MKKDNLTESWEDILAEDLQDDEYVAAYLSSVLQDTDPYLFLQMIRRVAKARHISMSDLAKRAGISRQAVYHVLSEKGNPEYSTLVSLMNALGFVFAAAVKKQA